MLPFRSTSSPLLTALDAVAQLQPLTSGLLFLSESDATLEVVSCATPAGNLSSELLVILQEPVDAPVQVVELGYFLRHHTAEDGAPGSLESAKRYQTLQTFLQQHLAQVQVYRVGSEPQIHAYVLGATADERLAGFKTVLIET